MKRISWTMAAILLGTALVMAGCKGKAGPVGAPGTGPTTTVFCTSPAQQGYTIMGPSSTWLEASRLYGCPVTLATAGTAISISHYVPQAPVTGQARVGLYSDNAGEPGNLIAEAAPQFVAPSAWNTFNLLSNTYLPAGTYWIAVLLSNRTDYTYTTTGGNYRYVDIGWSVLPQVFPAATTGTRRFTQTINVCP